MVIVRVVHSTSVPTQPADLGKKQPMFHPAETSALETLLRRDMSLDTEARRKMESQPNVFSSVSPLLRG